MDLDMGTQVPLQDRLAADIALSCLVIDLGMLLEQRPLGKILSTPRVRTSIPFYFYKIQK